MKARQKCRAFLFKQGFCSVSNKFRLLKNYFINILLFLGLPENQAMLPRKVANILFKRKA